MNGSLVEAPKAGSAGSGSWHDGASGYGTVKSRTIALILLTVIYALSLVDRIAIGIVQEPVKAEFGLTDFQLGLLGGPAFAILYSLLGLPLARLAEYRSRTGLISVSLALWSVATAVCGIVTTYPLLLAARLGVSVGEAGCTPPSQSVIVDSYPANRRATALAIYGLGVPLASLTAGFGGGWLAEHVGWRLMFVVLGVPGIVLALVLKLVVQEPPRAYSAQDEELTLLSVLRELSRNKTFWHLCLGASMSCFVGYGLSQYLVSFLMRTHDLSLLEASRFNGIMFGIFAGIGTFGCGYLCDRFAPRWPRIGLWLPAFGMLLAAPLFLVGYLAHSLWVAALFLMLGAMFNYFYLGSMYAVINGIVRPRSRTMATACTILFMNLLGYGLGPPTIGFLSDTLKGRALVESGLSVGQCSGLSGHEAIAEQCASASASGLQMAIVISLLGYVWAGLHFLASFRTVRNDRID